MTDWPCIVVAFGIVVPCLLAGACLFAEWACAALSHRWRMRMDPIYRDVEIQFRADLAEAGLDRDPPTRRGADDCGDWDDLLRAAEELSAQYDAIADGDRRRTAALANSLHGGFGGECGRETVRLVQRDHDEP